MADVLAVRDEYRLQQWAMIVQECSNSGLSNREFCRQRGISEKSFYYWQKKLREQIVDTASPQLVPLEVLLPRRISSTFGFEMQNCLFLPKLTLMRWQQYFTPFSRYDRSIQSPQLLYCLWLY